MEMCLSTYWETLMKMLEQDYYWSSQFQHPLHHVKLKQLHQGLWPWPHMMSIWSQPAKLTNTVGIALSVLVALGHSSQRQLAAGWGYWLIRIFLHFFFIIWLSFTKDYKINLWINWSTIKWNFIFRILVHNHKVFLRFYWFSLVPKIELEVLLESNICLVQHLDFFHND